MNCNNAPRLELLNREITACTRCPRLVRHREQIAIVKRRSYRDFDYWGKPVPSFGDPAARLLILGLAPGAHGANRTGRMFTGDRSGEFLYRSLHRAGFSSRPHSIHLEDGLKLDDAWLSASAHCAPPDNKPLPSEIANCSDYLEREVKLLTRICLTVALGRIALETYLSLLQRQGRIAARAPFTFAHNLLHADLTPALLCSYHPSQQNTSTGRLTQAMLDDLFMRARDFIRSAPIPAEPRP